MIPFTRLIHISRPRFWLYLGGPFLLGYSAGLPSPRDLRTLTFWLPFLYFLLPANLLLYGINDLFDADTDALSRKKENYEHRLIASQRRSLITALIGVSVLSIVFFVALPATARLTFALFLLLCVIYSAPPVRLKARAFLDSYSNALYILPGVIGYQWTAGQWPPTPIILAAICWAAGMHAYSAIPDIEPDRSAGIRTIAVALGESWALLFVAGNWAIGAALTFATLGWPGAVALIYPLIPLALWANRRWSVAHAYRWFPVLNAFIGFLAFVYLTLSAV
ncbi:MAG: prenyltransferase [Aggregatilineales bacterium]